MEAVRSSETSGQNKYTTWCKITKCDHHFDNGRTLFNVI